MNVCNAINQCRGAVRLLTSMAAVGFLVSMELPMAQAQEFAPRGKAPASTTGTSQSSGAQQPEVRYVSSSQAEIFAGPGEDFYPTAILKSGQSVEVVQEVDQWLAITPPPGSFSWLPAAQGLLMPGGRIVEVTEKSAVSWIGSSLGTAKQYRWQVRLAKGQQLSVIGEQTIEDPASGSKSLWYKIVPPPGEYRWIQTKATSRTAPAALADNDASGADENQTPQVTSIVDSQVVPASAEKPLPANSGKASPRRAPVRQSAHAQRADRWDSWHAVEFKNGSFTFPGLSRMLGMTPTEPDMHRVSDDPFDLAASYTRSRSQPQSPLRNPAMGNAELDSVDGVLQDEPSTSQMVARQSRGWRDPRQLRQQRLQGGLSEDGFNAEADSESALAALDAADGPAEVMDAGYSEVEEIGTGVITAGASEPVRRTQRRSDDLRQTQSWYGIDQAPASRPSPTRSVNQANLDELQLELSAMVAGPEHTWNLAPLADRARYFVEHGQNSIERGQARLLLERIESFGEIARNSTAVGLASSAAAAPLRALPASGVAGPTKAATASWLAQPAASPGADNQQATQFDATGWLTPVHSSGRDMPTHALTNDAGRIIVYVTAAPGVNLTRFESQAIGVYGLRGYLPQLKTNHVQVQRVVRLQ